MVSHSAANSTHTFAPALYSSCAKMFAIPHGCQFELRGSPRQGRLEQVLTSIGTQSVPHLLAPLSAAAPHSPRPAAPPHSPHKTQV